jgi:hypothetical protein
LRRCGILTQVLPDARKKELKHTEQLHFLSSFWRIAEMSLAALLVVAPLGSAQSADVRVQGSADAVRVEARDATATEILAALASRFALRYRGSADGRFNGTFKGPLREVVKRVLDGYNYVINTRDNGLDVVVMGPASGVAVPPPRPVPKGRQE